MISLRKILLLLGVLLLVLCLAVGYGIAGHGLGTALAVLVGFAWWLAQKYPDSPLPGFCLLASVGLAVVGRLTGSPAGWMISGSAAALVVWDLVLLDAALRKNAGGEHTRQYERSHLRALLLAMGSVFLLVLLGRMVEFQIPFVVLILVVAFVLFAFDRVWGNIKKAGKL